MKYLLLEDIKRNSVIEHDEDDEYLVDLGGSAEETMSSILGYDLDEIVDENGMLPKSIYQATMMLVETMYRHRGADVYVKMHENFAFRLLTQSWIRYGRG